MGEPKNVSLSMKNQILKSTHFFAPVYKMLGSSIMIEIRLKVA